MILFIVPALFLAVSAHNGTKSYKECLDTKFSLPNACNDSKVMHDLGKKACEIQGKKFDPVKGC